MIRKTNRKTLAKPFASNALSLLVRQIVEHVPYKKVVAGNIVLFATVLNVSTYPSHAFEHKATGNASVEASSVVVSTVTEQAYMFPVINPTGVSQRYGRFHPGVDIRAPRGNTVVAAAEGTVIEVKYLKSGYGHYIRIAHAGTVSSLYAHLDKIKVSVGQKVGKGEEVGTIGMTGWTTGPHLHFELNEGIKTINPGLALAI